MWLFVGLFVWGARGGGPDVRFSAEAPFRDGKRVASAWAKADRLVRFTTVGDCAVATSPSEAQVLFDEKNLYFSCRAEGDEKLGPDLSNAKLSECNNFEIFIQPDVPGAKFLHVMADDRGRQYVALNKAEIGRSGVVASVEKAKGAWYANVTVPFAAFGAKAPKNPTDYRIGIMRLNRNLPETVKLWGTPSCEENSWNPRVRGAYAVPETWAKMTLTRAAGEARDVIADADGKRVNLFANPDFDAGKSGWLVSTGADVRETLAMSGEWIVHAPGPLYVFLQGTPAEWEPDTEYTLVVKARSFGSGGAFSVSELVTKEDGTCTCAAQAAPQTGCGPEFHDYYFCFRTAPGVKPRSLVFYKHGDKSADSGIDVAAVKLFKGRVSTFEVRTIRRPGRQAPVKGTEIVRKTNPYGRICGKVRALALSSKIHTLREAVDLFEGTGIDADLLLTTAVDQDVYQTDSDPDAVIARINANQYDVYLVGRDVAARVGTELAGKIAANVRKGAGLYFEAQTKPGRFEPILKDVKDGRLGQGRVLQAKRAAPMVDFTPRQAYDRIGLDDYPYDDWALAEILSVVVGVARGVPAAGKAAKTDRTELVYGGERHAVEKAVDATGATVSWKHSVTPLSGPTLGAFADDGEKVTAEVVKVEDGLTLKWAFKDFSGRSLADSALRLGLGTSTVSFAVPREKLYTTIGVVALELVRGPQVLDRRNEAVYVPENDLARNLNDYCASMWPIGGEAYLRNVKEIYRQLEDVGITSALLPITCINAYPCTLLTGNACGGDFTGGGDVFCGRPEKSRVRSRQFNSRESRIRIAERARKMGESYRHFGIRQAVICDEPNLQYPGSSDELDEHPDNVAEYRARMAKKYGTIAEYNRRHRTSHADFASVGPALLADARKSGNFAEFIEWRNFNVDRWCEAIKFVGDNVKAVCPGFRHTIGCSFGPTAFSGNDYWKLLTRAGLDYGDEYTAMVYFSRSPLRNFDELYRSFRPDMRTLCCTGFFYSDERASILPWWTAAHRFGGFNWFAATSWGYNLLDQPGFAITADAKALGDSLSRSRMKDGVGKLMIDWPWAKRDIAIYYSHDSMLLATALGTETLSDRVNATGPLNDHLTSRMCAYYLVENLLYQHDFVAPEQVVGEAKDGEGRALSRPQRPTRRSALPSSDFLSSYKVLIMPRIGAMSESEVAAVKAFLAKGGRMVCDALPGDYDELGVKRAANPFAGAKGVTVWGKNFNDEDRSDRVRMLALLEAAGAAKVLASSDVVDSYGREAMRFVSGAADAYVVLRFPGRSSDDKEQEFVFAKRGHVYDVRARKYLGETDRIRVRVPKSDAAMFAVLPAKIDGIGISAPKSVTGGADLVADISVNQTIKQSNNQTIPSNVLHVEIVPPSGKPRFHFKRNLTAKDGKAHLVFPMALDDEKGTWRVRATEVLTGVTGESLLSVE